MKWEAILVRVPEGLEPEHIRKDWQPPSIGTLAEVKATLQTAFPNWQHDEGHSVVEADGPEVEFTYGVEVVPGLATR